MNDAPTEHGQRVVEAIFNECDLTIRPELRRNGAEKGFKLRDEEEHAFGEGDIKICLPNLPRVAGIHHEFDPIAHSPTGGLRDGAGQRHIVGVYRDNVRPEQSKKGAHLPMTVADLENAAASQLGTEDFHRPLHQLNDGGSSPPHKVLQGEAPTLGRQYCRKFGAADHGIPTREHEKIAVSWDPPSLLPPSVARQGHCKPPPLTRWPFRSIVPGHPNERSCYRRL